MATTLQLERPDPKPSVLSAELKAFIDGAIVPALLKEWLAENEEQNLLAPRASDVENSARLISDNLLSAEQGVTP